MMLMGQSSWQTASLQACCSFPVNISANDQYQLPVSTWLSLVPLICVKDLTKPAWEFDTANFIHFLFLKASWSAYSRP